MLTTGLGESGRTSARARSATAASLSSSAIEFASTTCAGSCDQAAHTQGAGRRESTRGLLTSTSRLGEGAYIDDVDLDSALLAARRRRVHPAAVEKGEAPVSKLMLEVEVGKGPRGVGCHAHVLAL